MSGPEMAAHFRGDWTVAATTSRASQLTLQHNSDGTVRLQQYSGFGQSGFGYRWVKADEAQVCLNMGSSIWRGMSGCYHLVQTGPGAYSMRSVANAFRLDYSR
jgi:hypothetical protein